MNRWVLPFVLVFAVCSTAVAAAPGQPLPADEAIQLLKAGNARHVAGTSIHGQQGAARREELALAGQRPFATILGCSDSRAPLEIVFDQGVGDIFVVRVAGNLAGPSELGSIEYAVAQLETPVVLVLGHTSCAAVAAAMQNQKVSANVSGIISQIRPAVAKAREWSPNASGEELMHKSIKANVWLTMEGLLRKSLVVREQVQAGRILLVGGVYDLVSGQVAWLGQHPEQGKILTAAQAPAQKPRPKPKPKAVAEDPAVEKGSTKAEMSEPAADAAAEAPPKPTAKPMAKPATKPTAKQPAKAGAKQAVEPAAAPEGNPNARSEGEGELLAPAPDKAPAKTGAKTAKDKGAHQ